ncbi:acyltransferase family protein [Streptomyces sp. NPDC093795]|uniref:acyltransferase family protein n=1 Tax=Streptomyces sp. NPDC093795 TaxID=3366051 RepID=UPI003829D2BE
MSVITATRNGRASKRMPVESAGAVLPTRLDTLTSLRFFAAFAVFAHHFTGVGNKTGFGLAPSIFPYSEMGGHGVTFFFVLSGFLLTWVYKPHEHPFAFYIRRVARIWPATLVAAVLAYYVFYERANLAVEWKSFIASLFLVQNWLPDATPTLPGNPVTWTLSVEILFYALFPLLARFVVRMRTPLLVGLTVVGLVCMWAVNWWAFDSLEPATARWVMRHPLVYLPQFLLGMTVALLLRRGFRIPMRPIVPLALLGAYVYGYFQLRASLSAAYDAQLEYTLRPTVAVIAALIIIAFVQREIAGHRGLLNKKPLILLGVWSFSFYLLHHAVIRFATYEWGRGQDRDSVLFTMLGMGLVIVAMSWALYRFVEEPANRWLVRRIPARWRPAPPAAPAASGTPAAPAASEASSTR